MNKKLLLGVLGLTGSLFAVDTVSSFDPYVAIRGGYSMLSKKDSVKYKNGFSGAVEFGANYDAWRFGLEVSYLRNKINEGKTANENIKGNYDKVSALSGMINVYYDYALTDECSLYVGAGLGVAKFSYDAKNCGKVGVEKTVFAWQLKAGVAYDINENWTVEAGYRLFNTSRVGVLTVNDANHLVKAKVKAPFANSLELGLRYNF